MIQLIKQRYLMDKNGHKKKVFHWYTPRKSYESVQELFYNLDSYIQDIPEEDRWNLHYTLCNCIEKSNSPRVFKSQSVIPFDIDGIDIERKMEYIDPVLDCLGMNQSDVGIVDSGRGLHFLIGTTVPISYKEDFEETRLYYKVICDRINRKLKSLKLIGMADPALWAPGHTLRLPGTKNIKNPEQGYQNLDFEGECKLITKVINPIPDLTIQRLSGEEDLQKEDFLDIKGKAIGGRYPIDTEGVLSECDFINWCRDYQADVKEPQWYAMLSVVGHLDDGRKLGHAFSKDHPGYSYNECEDKLDQAISTAGPRTCKKVESLWDGCHKCKHYDKITSPISIKGKNYIKTESTGFRDLKITTRPDGTVFETPGPVNYGDLLKFFEKKHKFLVTKNEIIYTYNGKYWEEMKDIQVKAFAEKYVNPDPSNRERNEFLSKIHVTHIVDDDIFFDKTTFRKLNLNNCVLDLSGKEPKILDHSPKLGFRVCLDYDYDPEATAPRYDRFMQDITDNRQELVDVMEEFIGHAIANEACRYGKCLILLGDGKNGKSTLIELVQDLIGTNNFSSLSAKDLGNEQHRAQLQGKILNLCEETPSKSFVDSSTFKNIITGGSVAVKVVYKPAFTIKNRAKLVMSCNKMPMTTDLTYGFLRRLIIVPFDVKFSEELGNLDFNIDRDLRLEMSGILNKFIAGYKRLSENKKFSKSSVIDEQVEEYGEENDPIRTFINTYVEVKRLEKKVRVPTSKLFRLYILYCDMEGIRQNERLNHIHFSRSLKNYFKDHKERFHRFGRKKTSCIYDIELIETKEDEQEEDF